MKNKIVFGRWEATTLIISSVCSQVFLNFPRFMAEGGGTAGWILTIYISILAFICLYIIYKLYKPFAGKDLMDIGEEVGGNVGRIIVGLLITAHFLFLNPIVMREFAEDMKAISLTSSPISFVILFFMAGMVLGAFMGLESIVRIHAVAVPIIAVGYLIIIIGILPFFDFNNLLPILGNGAYDIFGKGSLKISAYSGFIVLFLVIPYLRTYKNFKIVTFSGIGLSSFFLIIGSLAFLCVYPYPTALESFFPIYQLARLINYGRFFQRVESIFVLIWATAALLYLSMGLYFITYIFMKTFKLKYYKPLIIPFAIIIFNLSLMPASLMSTVRVAQIYFSSVGWMITFLLTIVLLLIAKAAKKNSKKAGEKKEKVKCE